MDGLFYRYYVPKEAYHHKSSPSTTTSHQNQNQNQNSSSAAVARKRSASATTTSTSTTTHSKSASHDHHNREFGLSNTSSSNNNTNHRRGRARAHGGRNKDAHTPSSSSDKDSTVSGSDDAADHHQHPPPPPHHSPPPAKPTRTTTTATTTAFNLNYNYGMMEAQQQARATSGSGSSTSGSGSISSQQEALSFLANPFELRHGRRYLRDLPYPLPCDLAETQRQNMRTLLGVTVFGKPICAPGVPKSIPKKVLELGCGAAYWSQSCHDWFASLGYPDVSFTGVDIAPLAPDLGRQGMNWRFVQHDLRRHPWPFEDEEFDFIMCKDMSLTCPIGIPTQEFVDECLRILAEKGVVEYWESDHILRCLRPHPPPPPGMLKPEEEAAITTKTYLISPGTPFAPAQNTYVANSNSWISEALDDLKLPPTPCARILNILYQEADTLSDVGFRRIAIPLGEFRWERERMEGLKHGRSASDGNPLNLGKGKGKAGEIGSTLTPDQAALRYTALLSVLQKIESLEPILREVSGKNSEEWNRWWANMTSSLLDQENGSTGEVLEVGAWWATKRTQ